jgi:hypothetical protein
MSDQVDRWRALASRLGFEVIAPATVAVGDERVPFTALLPQFGAERGMIADPDWEKIKPYADALWELGYGYSVVKLRCNIADDESAQEMLRDWGWAAPDPKPSWW